MGLPAGCECERHSGRPGSWKFASPVGFVCAMTPPPSKQKVLPPGPSWALKTRAQPSQKRNSQSSLHCLCQSYIRPRQVRMDVVSPPCRVPGSQGWTKPVLAQAMSHSCCVIHFSSPAWTCSSSVRTEPLPKCAGKCPCESSHLAPATAAGTGDELLLPGFSWSLPIDHETGW